MSTIRTEFSFLSDNGINTVRGIKVVPADGDCKAILHISHGMVEHYDRYTDFIEYMAQNGFAVYIHDHVGHKHSVDNDDQLGYFAKEEGYKCILNDLHHTAEMAKSEYPGKKYFILGHSMGSFYCRVFASQYTDITDGVLISGTGGPNKAATMGSKLVRVMIKLKGEKYRSELMNNIAFGTYLDKIENPRTKKDWITRDEAIVDKYVDDKYTQFVFTLSGFRDLMDIIGLSNDETTFKNTPDKMPVYIFSGSMDPVGDYGIGVMNVVDCYKTAGCTDVEVKIYDGGRHEMLNELNRREVYEDVKNWLTNKAEA
ncbi:MAG: alpha/beta fold hydrolase [Oscillospiraceae bacterium]|nr:alpha/beta fold hydrolase [Oscillospiraceae bacterium]